MSEHFRVVREDGYWLVEASDRRFWWTVSDDLKNVTNHRGHRLSATGKTGTRIIEAVLGYRATR